MYLGLLLHVLLQHLENFFFFVKCTLPGINYFLIVQIHLIFTLQQIKYQICASYYILWKKKQKKKTLQVAHIPIDLYSKRTSAALKLAQNSHTHSSLIYGFAKLPLQLPQQM